MDASASYAAQLLSQAHRLKNAAQNVQEGDSSDGLARVMDEFSLSALSRKYSSLVQSVANLENKLDSL